MSNAVWKSNSETKLNVSIISQNKKKVLLNNPHHYSLHFFKEKNEEVTNQAIDRQQTLIAGMHLNSRFQDEKKLNRLTSARKKYLDSPQNKKHVGKF